LIVSVAVSKGIGWKRTPSTSMCIICDPFSENFTGMVIVPGDVCKRRSMGPNT